MVVHDVTKPFGQRMVEDKTFNSEWSIVVKLTNEKKHYKASMRDTVTNCKEISVKCQKCVDI